MRGGSSLDLSNLWVFNLQIAHIVVPLYYLIKPQSLPSAFKTLITELHIPRVYGSLSECQHGLVRAEQVLRKSLGLWNFKKGTNTNISEIN